MRPGRTRAFVDGARPWPVLVLAFVLGVLGLVLSERAHAQDVTTEDEFWPEVDAFVRTNEHSRLMLQVSEQRGDDSQAEVGAHIDVFAKTLARKWLKSNPDENKKHYLTFRAGYRYYWDVGGSSNATENRILVEATPRFSMGRLFFLNRNRMEWRDQNGRDSWRYRNRSRLEGDVSLSSRTATPYVMAEFFYDSKYDEWDEERYSGGVEWPLGKKAIVETFYCRQNNTHSKADVNAFGLTVRLFF